jgi:molecular chaperone GrpE
MLKGHANKHEAHEGKDGHHPSGQPEKDNGQIIPQSPAAAPPVQPGEGAAAPEAPLQDEKVKKLEEEAAQLKDKMLRLAAEFDNYKKRMSKQFETVVKTANDELVLQIITIFDNFERALAAAKTNDDFSSFHQGVELIYKQLEDVLKKQGLQVIETVGREFNPHVHEAVMQVEEKDQPSQTVVQEAQKGYLLYDRVLRAAKVVVNK